MKKEMKKIHIIKKVKIENDSLKINIDSKDCEFKLSLVSSKLLKTSEVERSNYIISPSGYGIHWPCIDEDLSIDGLLKKRISYGKQKDTL